MKKAPTVYEPVGNVCSVGGGIQSFAMFGMACMGQVFDRDGNRMTLDFGVFADTGWERKRTYEAIEFLTDLGEKYGIPLHTVRHRNIKEDMANLDWKQLGMPFYILGKSKRYVPIRRQCTKDYKILPIDKFIKGQFNNSKKRPVNTWIGFSLDEAIRMKPSRIKRTITRFPLIEMRMTRASCHEWIKAQEFPMPVKSACIGCPCHKDDTWADLDEDELQEAIEFDNMIRNRPILSSKEKGKVSREHKNHANPNQLELVDTSHYPVVETQGGKLVKVLDDRHYLHESGEPLENRPFQRSSEDQKEIWGEYDKESEECEGGCFL